MRILAGSLSGHDAAVCGEVRVANRSNWITALQVFDYFISYNFFKAFESRFGLVTCAPGCFSLYRRSDLMEALEEWDDQIVLGRRCSYGEDRFLTTILLRSGRVVYQPLAQAFTRVPDSLSSLVKQRLRWARSWFANNLLVAQFIHRKSIHAAIVFHLIFLSTLLLPVWVGATLALGIKYFALQAAILLSLGLIQIVMALLMKRKEIVPSSLVYFAGFLVVLIWLIPVAIATITDNTWGSRF